MDDTSTARRYSQLTPKTIDDFTHQQEANGVRIGFEYYGLGKDATNQTVVIEVGVLNGTGEPIQVLPTDFAFCYQGQPAGSAQLEWDAAAPDLVDRGLDFLHWLGVAGSPAMPHEVVAFMPLLLALALPSRQTGRVPKDYLAYRRGKAALKRISFAFGSVPAGQFRHGLAFFQIKMSRDRRRSWPEGWDLTIDVVHHQKGPLVAEQSIRHSAQPYLPSIPVIVVLLALQFACFAGIVLVPQLLLTGSYTAAPFVCAGAYLVAALLVILALVFEYQ